MREQLLFEACPVLERPFDVFGFWPAAVVFSINYEKYWP